MNKIIEFNQDFNSPYQFNLLNEKEQNRIIEWIEQRLLPYKIKSFNQSDSSMAIKRLYEKETGDYVTNGELKGAMLKVGFKTKDKTLMNWIFNVSKKRITEMMAQ